MPIIPRQLPEITKEIEQSFRSKVALRSESECWLWAGSCTANRGMLSVNNESFIAARLAWAIHYKCDPYPQHVLHNCPGGDNPRCVNPYHLWLGDHADNLRDWSEKYQEQKPPEPITEPYVKVLPPMVVTGRVTHHLAKEIREYYKSRRVTLDDLASHYCLGKSTISRAINGYYDGVSVETNGCKLSDEVKADIKRQHLIFGIPRKELARKHKVGESTINRIVNS